MKIKHVERFDFTVTRKEAETIQTALKSYAENEETGAKESAYAFDLEDRIFAAIYEVVG